MPQLDFFTFPHQYLVASFCFCGMYYFNLLFFLPKIKFFQLNKIFSLKGLMANNIIILSYYYSYLIDLFSLENYILGKFSKRNKKIQKKIIFKKKMFKKINLKKKKKISFFLVSSKSFNMELNNSQNLFLTINLSFLFLFFFLKNFLIFNAEKLMLIYFLIITVVLFFLIKNLINSLIRDDLTKFLQIILNIEENTNKIINILKKYLIKLQLNLVINNLELLLLKNLEVKLFKKIK